MAVQPSQGWELPRAKVAFVPVTIPRALGCNCLHAIVARHRQHRPRDYVATVEPPHGVVNLGSVEAGGAAAGLEVDLKDIRVSIA